MSDNKTSSETLDKNRRRVLMWTPPAITAMALPVHAQMSECELMEIVISGGASKCSGTPPLGQATLTLNSPSEDIDIDVISITHDATGDNVITGDTSGTITSDTETGGLDIFWEGPASDVLRCLPDTNVNFVVRYTCAQAEVTSTFMFDLLSELESRIT